MAQLTFDKLCSVVRLPSGLEATHLAFPWSLKKVCHPAGESAHNKRSILGSNLVLVYFPCQVLNVKVAVPRLPRIRISRSKLGCDNTTKLRTETVAE
jgi:hypothetical protein